MAIPPVTWTRCLAVAAATAAITAGAAGAGTIHRMSITQTTGSGGAQTVLQNSATSSAFQGEVGGSSANSSIHIPFGLLGEFDPPGTTFGIGVIGISTTGYAVAGEALGNNPSVLGFAGGTGVGVEAVTPSSSSSEAMYAEAKGTGDGIDAYADGNGYGVYAESDGSTPAIAANATGAADGIDGFSTGEGGAGVFGSSDVYDGVHGEVANTDSGVSGVQDEGGKGFGVYAAENQTSVVPGATACPCEFAGAYGQSNWGPGVYGVGLRNSGVSAGMQFGQFAANYAGVFGFGNDGPGVFAFGSYMGAHIQSYGGADNANMRYPTLFVENETGTGTGSTVFEAYNDATSTATEMLANGDFFTSGKVTSGSDTFNATTRNPHTDLTTYSEQSAEATVEDVGTAQLVDGRANVPIAADFRQTMNVAMPYAVFLTPHADTNGLYLAAQTPDGFVVRESHGGRSTFAFDYRIVARPYGTPHPRLPHLASLVRPPMRPEHPFAAPARARTNGAAPVREQNRSAAQLATLRSRALAARHNAQLRRGVPPPVPASLTSLRR